MQILGRVPRLRGPTTKGYRIQGPDDCGSQRKGHPTSGAAPTSWRAFCATSAQRVRHRQSTTLAPGSAAGPSHSLGPPGDMAHVRRALANPLVAWAAMRFPPPPETLGWSDSAHST
ncbi:uncharacterized protein LAJ45_05445 [Morchella importuna]|uniref:uncharacterized protein n=1 Tax=Morchella importuna TaxID=1174673 RepID=UPI001E8DFEA9|nr:uncharacterized protein LAJ45_05445 [Morchella importuna]KAH8150749.1 hypothetical protein LAJ45_05445 [Morchella importuna]